MGNLLQIGVRAYSREEEDFINSDERVSTWFARDFLAPSSGRQGWDNLLAEISALTGPVWLTFDIDGLDGSLVPHTGTPVPGGLAHWQAVEIIETLFAAIQVEVIGADIAEIVAGNDSNLTQFSAAMIATKIVAAHIATL